MYHTRGKYAGNYIHPTAVISESVKLGKGNYIEAGAVIGVPGHIRDKDPEDYTGTVAIGDFNRIGANTVVHYGERGVTEIGDRNIIMALVNIGHDVTILSDCEICPHVAIAGHCRIESGVKIKMNCTINSIKTLASGTFVYSGSIVTKSTSPNKSYMGSPAREVNQNKINL